MSWEMRHGDCLELMRAMPDNSVDAVVTDPPYFRVKDEEWDRQWDSAEKFVAWMGLLCEQWQRVLKPNGSLYVFASPKMAWHVEGAVRERFAVLNRITWEKERDRGKHAASCKEALRGYFPNTETIIFAEHYGADNIAKGEAGYAAKCDELRGFVFEPLRAYLDGERERAGWRTEDIGREWMRWKGRESKWTTRLAGHWFERVQWALPTAKNYAWLRELFNAHGGDYLRREYEDLRREYEDLRREYEDLRRPFTVTAEDQYTDVWTFPTVQAYKGKHVCEKPLALMEHIIKASTRPGAVVLDCFAGSCATGHACLNLGRDFIGMEKSAHWVQVGSRRLELAKHGARTLRIAAPEPEEDQNQLDLFKA